MEDGPELIDVRNAEDEDAAVGEAGRERIHGGLELSAIGGDRRHRRFSARTNVVAAELEHGELDTARGAVEVHRLAIGVGHFGAIDGVVEVLAADVRVAGEDASVDALDGGLGTGRPGVSGVAAGMGYVEVCALRDGIAEDGDGVRCAVREGGGVLPTAGDGGKKRHGGQ